LRVTMADLWGTWLTPCDIVTWMGVAGHRIPCADLL